MLDLTSFYDALLPGQSYQLPSTFRTLEPGTYIWQGIKFDVHGIVMSQGQPDRKIIGIPVGQKCSGLAFLHGVYGFGRANPASQFVVHFADGHAETIPIVFGKDVDSSRISKNRDAPTMPLTNSVVWSEIVPTNGPPRPGMKFFIKKWSNPFPGEIVTTVDFEGRSLTAIPFLVAITIRPANP